MAPPPDQRTDFEDSERGIVKLATVWHAPPSYSYAGDSVAARLTFQIKYIPPSLMGENNTVSTLLEFDSIITYADDVVGDPILYANFGDGYYEYTTRERLVGDVDGDRNVDLEDQHQVQLAMFTVLGDLRWNQYADMSEDGDVDVRDQRKQQLHMFQLHMFESW